MATEAGSGWMQLPSTYRTRMRKAVIARDGGVCQLKLKGCTYHATQADHVRLARLHGHGLDNLQAACAWCNRAKGEPLDESDPTPLRSAWA